jgi:hypothetical protein
MLADTVRIDSLCNSVKPQTKWQAHFASATSVLHLVAQVVAVVADAEV